MSTQEPFGIDREEVRRLLREEDAQLVEVLSRGAFDALHLPGAINVPLADLDEDRVGDLDRNRPVIVYCYDDL
ncbi:MAG TPA: rhodanese-like domain-containing protein [Acidimicrobiia bacterium]|nr:rhodanese-like domain-containing protein [Acidimicrobiia bacterium]